MSASLAVVVVALGLISYFARAKDTANTGSNMKSVRTYLKFSHKIDPAHIVTMADLQISMALSTPLVTFNAERQVVAGLAEKWAILPPRQIKFTLRDGLKWSDSSPIKADEYQAALERARSLYGGDLKALFDLVEKIEATDDRTLVFTTKSDVAESGILLKLTEPMYGLLALKDGNLDLSKSAGPFVVKDEWADELILSANPTWYAFDKAMPKTIEIRRPKDGQVTIESFEKDDWANLISATSIMAKETREQLDQLGYKIRQRSLDKAYGIFASKRFLEAGGSALLKNIAAKIDRAALMREFSGYADAEQFFPRGYILYSQKTPNVESATWRGGRPISVVTFWGTKPDAMTEALSKQISAVSEGTVEMTMPPLTQLNEVLQKGDFDILTMSLAVADPNFEGAMSFFIERHPPMIQSMAGKHDFAAQMRAARGLPTSEARAARMREIMIAAQEAGHFIPLFHFSSLAIAKPELDLSGIPNSDETVLFSKVRIK